MLCFQDGRVERMSDALVPATPENKRVAIDWVRGRTVTGTSQGIGDAFRQAAELRPTRILAITEAVLTPEDLAEARESLRRSGVPVNVLAYGPADGEVPTSRVLAGNGGQWRKAPRE